MTRRRVASRSDVPAGKAIVVEAGDQRLALCNVDGSIYAIDDVCTHDGGPLGEGELIGDQIECPRHGARFDVRSGRVTRMPAVRPVKTYTLEEEGGDLYVDLPDDDW
jgi:3-phenylpropionate/trans-cinnamate dioxygenase ferredoxin component